MKEDLECLEKEIQSVEFKMERFLSESSKYAALRVWRNRLIKAKEALLIKIMEKYE